jgi:hypothetical protein
MTFQRPFGSIRLFLLVVLCVVPASGQSAVSRETSFERLHREIVSLANVQCDPKTSAAVRAVNTKLLERRRSEIKLLLEQQIAELKSYSKRAGVTLSDADLRDIAAAAAPLQTELKATQSAGVVCERPRGVRTPSLVTSASADQPLRMTVVASADPPIADPHEHLLVSDELGGSNVPSTAIEAMSTASLARPKSNLVNSGVEQAAKSSADSPVVLNINPPTATAGGDAFQLTVTGTNFGAHTVVLWNGEQRATTARTNDSTQLTATINARDIAQPGSIANIEVEDLQNSTTSNSVELPVLFPQATLASMSPTDVAGGDASENTGGITLHLYGTNFLENTCGITNPPGCSPETTQVSWNGRSVPATYVSPTELQVTLTRDDLKRDGSASIAVQNPKSTGGASPAILLTIHAPEPVAGGTLTHRAIVGTDVSGASSLPTQQKVYIEFNLDAPLRLSRTPHKYICDDAGVTDIRRCSATAVRLNPRYVQDQDPLNHPLWIWVNSRVSSLPQQGGSLLSSSNVQTSSDFLNSLISSKLNQVVQGFEFLGGLEWMILRPRSGVPFPFVAGHSRLSASLIGSMGAITPFAVQDKTQQEFVATTAGLARFGAPNTTVCTGTITTSCFQDIAFVPEDRTRFFRQYYGGVRFKTWYFLDPTATADKQAKCLHGQAFSPNDVCKQFPGVFDILFGQNESVTGGRLQGSVARFDGYFPIPSFPGIYIYGTAILRLARSQPSAANQTPVVLSLDSNPLSLSDPRVFLVNDPGANRDFFRIGMGVDLIHLISSLKSKTSTAMTSGTQPSGNQSSATTMPAKPAGTDAASH